jgi:DNA-binding NtrC family response regulator
LSVIGIINLKWGIMNILIVEDSKDLGPLLKALLIQADRLSRRNVLAQVRVVQDLAAAVEHLAEADAILCDGEFPLNDSAAPAENWSLVAYRASACNIATVVYSGNEDIVHKATLCGLSALNKPASADEIYGALMRAFDRKRDTRFGVRETGTVLPTPHIGGISEAKAPSLPNPDTEPLKAA